MTELDEFLAAAGFSARAPQTRLFDHLITATRKGVVAQAGTGTGKSAAIISAAANRARNTGTQSIIVTPTLTLMNQYLDGETPIAQKAFTDLAIAEVRGRSHYFCEMTKAAEEAMGSEYVKGCLSSDVGCSAADFDGLDIPHRCDYQIAKRRASAANIVITNADMLIVNDRVLAGLGANFLEVEEGSLFVDEAHTLEMKLRDYASRSIWHGALERFAFAGTAGPTLARWVKENDQNLALKDTRGFPESALREIAFAKMPNPHPQDGLTKQRETQEACMRLLGYLANPHDSAVAHVGGGSLKMDWINISASSRELLTARDFGLVSATVPRSMATSLGVADAPFIDVGHPFDYANQAWLGISPYGGDYRSSKQHGNFEIRAKEILDLITRAKGGALILFSSFMDLERVWDLLAYSLKTMGLTVLKQERDMESSDKQALADSFKADGNAVLFGSESFATGFDVPGDALRLVVLWKLPYPAVDPVSNAIREASFARYEDMMKVRAIQAIGRLIRRETDKGVVWIADTRGRKLIDPTDPLTSHIPQFARL